MMTKIEFAAAVRDEVAGRIGDGYDIEMRTVRKNNGTQKTAVTITGEGANIAPAIYIDSFYDGDAGEGRVSDAADFVMKSFQENGRDRDIDLSSVTDYARAREGICFRLVNAEKNREMLDDVPHVPIHDLAAVFYLPVDIGAGEDAKASALITSRMMESWGADTDDLYVAALENTPAALPVQTKKLGDLLGELTGAVIGVPDMGPAVYVATVGGGLYGAAVLMYPGFLKAMGDRLGKDFYILPSSIHEILIMPDDGETEPDQLKKMVMDVNATAVEAEDFLSDSVYFYDREKDELSILGGSKG